MNPGKERMESPNTQRDQKCRAKWHLEASKNFSVFHTLSKSWAPTMSWEACNKFLELEGGEKQTQSSCFHWDESNDTSQADPWRTCRGASTLTKTWVSGKAFQSNHCVYCPWNSPGKNTRVGCHFLLQEVFLTHGSNLGVLHGRQILYHLSHQGSSDS